MVGISKYFGYTCCLKKHIDVVMKSPGASPDHSLQGSSRTTGTLIIILYNQNL